MLEPLQDEFMRRAIAEIALIGAAGGLLGCWVVLYGLSYATESLSHSIFPGLVIAALIGAPVLAGGVPAIVVAALAIAVVSRIPGIAREVAIGVVVTTLFGVGVLLALSAESPPGIQSLLFGDILGSSGADLVAAAILVAAVVACLAVFHERLLAGGFDRSAARMLGAAPSATEAVLMVLLAAAIVVSVQGLGNLLVVAVFVGPAAAAREVTDRVGPMMAASVAIALLAGVSGLYLSYYAGTAAGASIALAICLAYLLALLCGRLLEGNRRGPLRPGATIG